MRADTTPIFLNRAWSWPRAESKRPLEKINPFNAPKVDTMTMAATIDPPPRGHILSMTPAATKSVTRISSKGKYRT